MDTKLVARAKLFLYAGNFQPHKAEESFEEDGDR